MLVDLGRSFLMFFDLLETFGLPKWSFVGDIFEQKPILYKKCEPCESTAPASRI